MPILMRSGVVEREMITWKMSHCKSPWMKISLEEEEEKRWRGRSQRWETDS